MTAESCKQIIQQAIETHGKPDIINSDQGSQFTSLEHVEFLKTHGIQISMDGKGRAIDNIFIERLWKSVKYECVYLYAFEDGVKLYEGLKKYFTFTIIKEFIRCFIIKPSIALPICSLSY